MKTKLLNILLAVLILLPSVAAFPTGVNLSPLGGANLGGAKSDVNWNPVSTYVFIDYYKHCSPLYIRTTNNGGQSVNWVSESTVARRSDLYPQSLPYVSASNFHLALCDLGKGEDQVPSGRYTLMWDGEGVVDVVGKVSYARRGLNNIADVDVHMDAGSTAGLTVRILQSRNIGDPVRHVRLVPTAFEHNYTVQVFQPSFLALLKPFDHLRFTGWQKVTSAKNWTLRTLPSFQTQHHSDGVAVEHVVDLLLATGIRSISLSFPLLSSQYNSALVDFLARNLPSDTIIYFESGSIEWGNGDTDRAAETVALADRFDAVFGNIQNIRDDVSFTWRAFVSVYSPSYVPYIINWFGSRISRLHSVAVAANFGRSTFAWDGYNSFANWNLSYANKTVSQLIVDVQNSVHVAEVDINRMIQRLLGANPNLKIMAFTGGPHFIAANYGYRAGKNSVLACASNNKFPCVWANTQYRFENQSVVDKALAMMKWNATQEQILEDKLIEVQRSAQIYDIYLDFLRRWEAVGGGLFIGSNLIQPVTKCPNGGKGCGNDGLFERFPLDLTCSTSCAKYSALVDFKSGVRSSLPHTSAGLVLAPALHVCQSKCEWGTCQYGKCVCFAGYGGASCNTPAPKRPDCNSDTGINLAGVVDWSSEWTYVDIFKGSRAWISQRFYPDNVWNSETTQHLAEDYPSLLMPNQRLGSMMIRDLQEHIPSGVYVVLYDGDGILTFGMDVVAEKRSVGRVEVTVVPSSGLNNGLFLMVERTNPANPIRNVRVFMPGFEHWPVPFHPFYLDSIKNYKVLRFMDLANTNSAVYSQWNQRSMRNRTRSYSGAAQMSGSDKPSPGVPIEDMVLLSNMVGAAPWFNIPHLADDDFIRRYAALVKEQLRPDVKIYVEYSNEVWGTLFKGGIYAQQQGLALGLAPNDADARFCYYAKRSSEIFTIWKTVFGPSGASRLEFVYASQSVNADVTRRILSCSRRLGVTTNATVIAIAPYFGSYNSAVDKSIDIFMNTTLPRQIAGQSSMLREHWTEAKKFGMKLVTYESGQGLVGSGKNEDLAILANRDARMTNLYVAYFDMLRAANVSLMMQFTSTGLYTTSMCFGLMEASDQDPKMSPKYLGLQQYIRKHQVCDLSQFDAASMCSYSGVYVEALDRCECYYGSDGQYCDTNGTYTEHTDLCGYFCYFHQGDCVPDSIVGNERYWACSCHEGYYGHQCALFHCQDSCNYNGQCLDKDICSCFAGYTGEFCELDCGCGGNGACNADNTGCDCDVGFDWAADKRVCEPLNTDTEDSCNDNFCDNGVCVDHLCTCYAGYSGESCDIATSARSNQNSQVGTNLGGIAYWTTQWSFVDVMKMSSDWISLDFPGLLPSKDVFWDNGKPVHLRSDGYPAYLEPGQILAKLLLRDVHLHAPSGRYVCLFDGDGVIDFGFDAETVAIGKNRVEFMFAPTWKEGCTSSYCGDNGILLQLLSTNRSNPVRNIRVIMPGFEAVHDKIPFHPWFIQNIQPYSVLRFMDWQHTNGNLDISWSDRTTPSHDTQARTGGVALEHMIELSNVIGAAPWFCMPHKADDNYIRQFATMVKSKLRSDVQVYVEYSNEVWNGLFPQATYASERGLHLKLSSNEHTARYRFYSQRSVEIFHIWEDVFGSSSSRLKKVLSTQSASVHVTHEILSWKNASKHASFVGVGPYFDCDSAGGPKKAGYTAILSVDALIAECNSSWAYLTSMLDAVQAAAGTYGLPVITYEAGQSLVETNVMQYGNGETAGLTALLIATNRAAGMKELYLTYMRILSARGVFSRDRPLMSFSSCGLPSKYGSWGTIEYTGQPVEDTPKYQALSEYFFSAESVCSTCTANAVSPIGFLQTETYTYVGHPAVLSPRYNDVWVSGDKQEVAWFTDTIENRLELLVHKVQAGNKGSQVVWQLGYSVDASTGRQSIEVPSTLLYDGKLNYFLEIRGQYGSNFSDVFSIQSKFNFENTTYVCCAGDMIPSFEGCLKTNRTTRSNVRYHNSSWAVKSSVTGGTCSSPFAGWEISVCSIDIYGCRNYRTARVGTTYGNFKPVVDCVAKSSPYPVAMTDGNIGENDAGKFGHSREKMSSCLNLINNFPQYLDSCPANLGIGDSRCNISEPTQLPTVRPTMRPSAWPTQVGVTKRPTKMPTQGPSLAPSYRPSPAPSRKPIVSRPGSPTEEPTMAPTALTMLVAKYSQNLEGIEAQVFEVDMDAQNAFKETVAEKIGTNVSSVMINGIHDGEADTRTRQLRAPGLGRVLVDYVISLTIQDLNTQDLDVALRLIGDRISNSVTDGGFLTTLLEKVSSSSAFENVTVSAPSFKGSTTSYLSLPPALSPTLPPTVSSTMSNASDEKLVDSLFFIIGVCVIGLFVVMAIGGIIYCHKMSNPALNGKKVSPRN